MSKFRFSEEIESFIGSLDSEAIISIIRVFSKWRGNNMDDKILKCNCTWYKATFEIGAVLVGSINDTVDPLLKRNGFMLHKISIDQK